ncbi:MAG: amidohydrolase family protein, partial [Acidimicrobiia bacterium]
MSGVLIIRNAEVAGRFADVTVEDGRIASVSAASAGGAPHRADVIDARGGALLPGLCDHHLHLLALAAARRSVLAGPPAARTAAELGAALAAGARQLAAGEWLRAVGYHESVAGPLGRAELDRLVPDRPVRLQHRSGAMWILNTPALDRLGAGGFDHAGVERDGGGAPTGRLFGLDDWLRDRLAGRPPPLRPVGEELARYGVTGVTDATPTERGEDASLLADAVRRGDLPQRVRLTGGLALDPESGSSLVRGPVKLVVADHQLPGVDDLARQVAAAHRLDRHVAVHCVTRT